MSYFRDLEVTRFSGGRVYLDLDGTLVPDGEKRLGNAEANTLRALSKVAEVIIVSNKGEHRAPRIAHEFTISAADTSYRKPDPRIVQDFPSTDRPTFVLGDKYLTDGIFASRIGAEFIKFTPLQSGEEDAATKSVYRLDAAVFTVVSLFRLARPLQWVKNAFIPAPLFFAGGFFDGAALFHTAIAFVAFSAAASAGYVINDLFDKEEDEKHPTKRLRPIAHGEVSGRVARVFVGVLVIVAGYATWLVPSIAPWIFGYAVLTYFYSHTFRAVPVVEFMMVPLFYLIRVFAGGAAGAVAISEWFLLLTFFGTLFITVSRRYSEATRGATRKVLTQYPANFLVLLPAFAATLTIVAYALYSILAPFHRTLVYSNIFVVFGVIWYLKGVYGDADGEHPDAKLWRDKGLLFAVLGWALYIAVLLYGEVILQLFL